MDQNILAILALVAFYVLQALAGRKRRQGQVDDEVPLDLAESPQSPNEMDEALAEIRRALGMGGEEPAPKPTRAETGRGRAQEAEAPDVWQPAPQPASRTSRAQPPKTRTEQASQGTSRTARTSGNFPSPSRDLSSDDFHRVVTGRPDFEDRFENSGAEWRAPVPERKPLASRTIPVRTLPASRTIPATRKARTKMRDTEFRDPLRDHHHLDEAPVVQTAIGAAGASPRRYPDAESLRKAFEDTLILGPPRAYKGYRD